MSTTGLFRASRPDGRSDWRVVFDVVEQMSPGEQVSHEDLLTELGTDDHNRLYRAVGRANRELWATRSRSLASVRGAGYRMLMPDEHERLASGYQRQARGRVGSAVAVMRATDLSGLSDGQREWAVKVTAGLVMMARVIDEHAARLAHHDALIREVAQQGEMRDEELAQRVEKIETRLAQQPDS